MRKKAITEFGVSLVLILGVTLFFYFNFTTVVVSGHSMEPTFQTGQRLLAARAYWLVGGITDGSVIVIQEGSGRHDYLIKRVYKTAGEVVDWPNVPSNYRMESGPFVVPADSVYVLGDNREVSEDSRRFGPVPLNQVIGKIVVK